MARLNQEIHVLTLVVKRERDIPLVRSKAKILGGICKFGKIRRVQLALAASELARYLLHFTQGGKAIFYIVCKFTGATTEQAISGIKLHFKGKRSCSQLQEKDVMSHGLSEVNGTIPVDLFSSLKSIMDEIDIKMCKPGTPIEISALLWGGRESCEILQKKNELIREQLFSDIEESYLENLRAKHQEVLELLKSISQKNMELDKVNAELLELSKDMESLVHERTVVEFALRIADKVRNPATIIGGLSRMILKKIPLDFPERHKIEAIFREALKLEDIVKDFEGLAKEQKHFFKEIDLKELVKEIVDAWRPNLEHKDLRLNMKMVEDALIIHANPRTLKVALLHILKNAVDASPHGARLDIEVTRINGKPIVSIKDYGPGIKKEIQDKLFKELVTTKPSGTGVGLIMVHHILREHQGEIEIESKPGLGTNVRLIFPIRWKEGPS